MRLVSLRTDAIDAEAIRQMILVEAGKRDVDSVVVVEAIAQVLAVISAKHDEMSVTPVSLEDRMAALTDRVRALRHMWLVQHLDSPLARRA